MTEKKVAPQAVALVGMKGEAARLTAEAMVRNLTIAEGFGCLYAAGLQDLRRRQVPTVRRAQYTGEQLSVDHTSSCDPSPRSWKR